MVSAAYDEHLDFFSIQVPDGAFTSRLATCKVGDTVYVEKTAYGYLTTSRFVGGSNLWLLATGTGIRALPLHSARPGVVGAVRTPRPRLQRAPGRRPRLPR